MLVMSKLQNVRVALQNTKLNKSGHNKFAGYKYFELGDFLPQVNELFQQVGLFSQISYTADIATLTITCVENGSSVVFTSPMGSAALKGCHEVQNIGAVETYQRRYLYVTALEIVEHDALDSSKPVTGVIKATDGAVESISPERLEVVNKVASAMQDWLDENQLDDAILTYENASLETDEKVFLWTKFSSTDRSRMKKRSEAMRVEARKKENV